LGPTLSFFRLQIDPRLFSALGLIIQGHKVQNLLVTCGQIDFFFFVLLAMTPSVKPLGLISTFAPIEIEMLGLG